VGVESCYGHVPDKSSDLESLYQSSLGPERVIRELEPILNGAAGPGEPPKPGCSIMHRYTTVHIGYFSDVNLDGRAVAGIQSV